MGTKYLSNAETININYFASSKRHKYIMDLSPHYINKLKYIKTLNIYSCEHIAYNKIVKIPIKNKFI